MRPACLRGTCHLCRKKKKKDDINETRRKTLLQRKEKKNNDKTAKKKKSASNASAKHFHTFALSSSVLFFFFSVFLSFLSHICLCFCLSKKQYESKSSPNTSFGGNNNVHCRERTPVIHIHLVQHKQSSAKFLFFFFRGQNCRQPIKKKKKRELRCI